MEIALDEVDGEIETSPEGKTVESIEVVALEVFEERDQVPLFLNWFHTTTQDYVIKREVLLERGGVYTQSAAAETERNLRALIQLSVVLVVPLKGSTKDRVRVLVLTKDIWSLRLNWAPSFHNGKLTGLVLAPSEWNIAGTTQQISGNLALNARNYSVGGSYTVRRIGGSQINGVLVANAILNCATSALEGATGYMSYGQPLVTTHSEWSWMTAAYWASQIRQPVEDFGQSICADQGAPRARMRELGTLEQTRATVVGENGTSRVTTSRSDIDVLIPNRYREEIIQGQLALTRSFNRQNKFNFSFGIEADLLLLNDVSDPDELTGHETLRQQQFDPNDPTAVDTSGYEIRRYELDEQLIRDAQSAYRTRWRALNPPRDGNLLPRSDLILSDRRVSPYLQMRAFRNSHLRTINYNTLGLQEDVQLGHEIYLRAYPAFRPLSSRDLIGMYASAAYTLQLGSGFLRGVAASNVEMADSGNEEIRRPISGPEQSDAQFAANLHFVSPRLGLGRLVSSATLAHTPIGFLNRFPAALGGTGRLRGYEPSSFFGTALLVANTEFRSAPVRIYSMLAGFSLFHDMGDASYSLADFELKHAGGVGLRLLFPQLDRDVIRVDFGFPLQQHDKGEFTLVAVFGQAFGTPAGRPPVLLSQ
jgi:hypothetical protein